MDPVRLAIIDSWRSSDTHPIDLALKKFPREIRDLIKSIKSETAAEPVICKKAAAVHFVYGTSRWMLAVHPALRLLFQLDNALWKLECRSSGWLESNHV